MEPLPKSQFNVPNFPNTDKCDWSFDETTRVVLASFKPEVPDPKDVDCLLRMMERTDIAMVSEGLLIKPEEFRGKLSTVGTVDEVKVKLFKLAEKTQVQFDQIRSGSVPDSYNDNKNESTVFEHWEEQDGMISMLLSEFLRYIRAWAETVNTDPNSSSGSTTTTHSRNSDALFTFTNFNGKDYTLNLRTELLYVIDDPMADSMMIKLGEFRKMLRIDGILPAGDYCMMHHVPDTCIPDMGPNLYRTRPGAFTTFHQDGHGTVDSGHLSVEGYNQVVMLRRMDATHKTHALHILSGADRRKDIQITAQTLYIEPHDDNIIKSALWPDCYAITKCQELNYYPCVFILKPRQHLHINKGRLHAFRKASRANLETHDCHEKATKELFEDTSIVDGPCNSVAWDWMYRGRTQKGIEEEVCHVLECAKAAKRLYLAIPELALYVMATHHVNDLLLKRPNTIDSEASMTILKGIWPSLSPLLDEEIRILEQAVRPVIADISKFNTVGAINPPATDFHCETCWKELGNSYWLCKVCLKSSKEERRMCATCIDAISPPCACIRNKFILCARFYSLETMQCLLKRGTSLLVRQEKTAIQKSHRYALLKRCDSDFDREEYDLFVAKLKAAATEDGRIPSNHFLMSMTNRLTDVDNAKKDCKTKKYYKSLDAYIYVLHGAQMYHADGFAEWLQHVKTLKGELSSQFRKRKRYEAEVKCSRMSMPVSLAVRYSVSSMKCFHDASSSWTGYINNFLLISQLEDDDSAKMMKMLSATLSVSENDSIEEFNKSGGYELLFSKGVGQPQDRRKGSDVTNNDGYEFTPYDLQKLRPKAWCNDIILNCFFQLVNARELSHENMEGNCRYKANHCFMTFAHASLMLDVVDGKGRRLSMPKGRDIFTYSKLIFPCYKMNHWFLVIADLDELTVTYLDSGKKSPSHLSSQNECETGDKSCSAVLQFIERSWNEKETSGPFAWSKWHFYCGYANAPKQLNSDDCGIFVCLFGLLITSGFPVSLLAQNNVKELLPIIRNQLARYLVQKALPDFPWSKKKERLCSAIT